MSISPDQIRLKHAYLRSQVLVKQKLDGTISCRLSIDGSRQPADSYNDTHAGTSDTERLLCLTSACIADSTHRGVPLEILSFDIPAAFIQPPLTPEHTNVYQFITRLPSYMPGSLAGQLNEITFMYYPLTMTITRLS
jgi:hypothetical protein